MNLELVSLIFNFILGTGLISQFVFFRINKRKATADAAGAETSTKSAEVNLVSDSVRQMVESVSVLMKQNKELIQEIADRRKENEDLVKTIEDLKSEISKYIRTNKDVIKALESLKVDQGIINKLKDGPTK